ncbi:hypothetical protein [Streptomyces sp. NPDC057910]|uniref:hypothetical protein n=1 Tax=Streptomyces sp. NPDC057910 TaxID=3346278 RepID=UPI0036F10F49
MSDYRRLDSVNSDRRITGRYGEGSVSDMRNLRGCRVDDLDEGLSREEAEYAAAQYQAMGYGCVALPEDNGPGAFWRVYEDASRACDVTDHTLAVLP